MVCDSRTTATVPPHSPEEYLDIALVVGIRRPDGTGLCDWLDSRIHPGGLITSPTRYRLAVSGSGLSARRTCGSEHDLVSRLSPHPRAAAPDANAIEALIPSGREPGADPGRTPICRIAAGRVSMLILRPRRAGERPAAHRPSGARGARRQERHRQSGHRVRRLQSRQVSI